MATVNFLLRTKKNPANINIRFTHGRNIDIFDPLNIYVNPIHWNKDLQKIRNVIEVQNKV